MLSLSCDSQTKLVIAFAKFSRQSASLLYCRHEENMDDFSEVCTDISVTSNVINLCQGKQKCSFLVDFEQFPLLSNNDSSSREISCHKNYSVLKTTAACVDKRILDMKLVSNSTEKTSLITTASTTEQLHI